MQNLDFATCPNSALYSKRKISDYAVHFVSVSLIWNSSFIFIFKMFVWLCLVMVAACIDLCCIMQGLLLQRRFSNCLEGSGA